MKQLKKLSIISSLLLLLIACGGHPDVPESAKETGKLPKIYPDYCNVTVPQNIAPTNFMVADEACTACVARLTSADGTQQTYGGEGRKVLIPEDEWQQFTASSAGNDIKVELWAKYAQGWEKYKTFSIRVAEPVDEYISYRLIEPSYLLYDRMCISQRKLNTFDEEEVFNNKITVGNKKGQCINCHSYQNYSTENMLFHVRVTHGGTIFVIDGKPKKVDLKREGCISAGVYPAWHPTEKLVAFSTNKTAQIFHTVNKNKAEVFDMASDLILYDIKNDTVTLVCTDTTRLEVFPTWSPDGKWLYYCVAEDSLPGSDIKKKYNTLFYNIYRKSFDAKTLTFGEEELVYDAAQKQRSCSLPRISPDGRYLAFAEGCYGCFNIWHNDADILLLDLKEGRLVNTHAMNSARAESYPSWSSNGHWLMCASRRDDGNYSRVYMAYFDGKKAHKAFLLPQRDPEHNVMRLKSYNRPEFMKEPIKISVSEFANVVKNQ